MRLPHPRLPLLPAVLVALLAAGCAQLGRYASAALERPRLTFRSASLQALDLEGATLGFEFDLENPNGFGVSVARLGYGVEVEGTKVTSGDLPGGLKVPASGTAPVTFPVRIRFADVPGIVQLVRSRDAAAYRLSGTVGVDTPAGVLDVPLSHEGKVELPDLPTFSLDGVQVRSISFGEMGLDVRVRMSNPNPFPIPAGRLDYALALGGSPVARGEGRALERIQAKGSSLVSIPVTVDLAQAGKAATDIARGAPVEVGLRGKAELAGLPIPFDLAGRLNPKR